MTSERSAKPKEYGARLFRVGHRLNAVNVAVHAKKSERKLFSRTPAFFRSSDILLTMTAARFPGEQVPTVISLAPHWYLFVETDSSRSFSILCKVAQSRFCTSSTWETVGLPFSSLYFSWWRKRAMNFSPSHRRW